MDKQIKTMLVQTGILIDETQTLDSLNGLLIPRELLLNPEKYEQVKFMLAEIKKTHSSSVLTSLHQNAPDKQRWPLLNFVRQIMGVYGYKLIPIRKCDGYTLEGVKKFKRFFQITGMRFVEQSD